jgi:hypothetical protein
MRKKPPNTFHQTGVNWATVMPCLTKNKLVRYGTKLAVNGTHQGGARWSGFNVACKRMAWPQWGQGRAVFDTGSGGMSGNGPGNWVNSEHQANRSQQIT